MSGETVTAEFVLESDKLVFFPLGDSTFCICITPPIVDGSSEVFIDVSMPPPGKGKFVVTAAGELGIFLLAAELEFGLIFDCCAERFVIAVVL